MHRITLIALIALLIPDLYIYFCYIRKYTHKLWLRIAWWLPTLLLIAAFVHLMFLSGPNHMAQNPHAIGHMAIAILLFTVPKALFMLITLPGSILHVLSRRIPRTPFTFVASLLAVITFGCILYGAVKGVSHFQVKEVCIEHSSQLPKGFDGFRIAQISDLHLGSWSNKADKIEELVNLINEQHPDIILFTGDLVNHHADELKPFMPILAKLNAPHGVYSVLGNHDYGTYYRWPSAKDEAKNLEQLIDMQKEMGWKMLNNQHTLLYNRGDSIALVGVENDGEPPFSQHAQLKKATQGTERLYTILMSHNPTHWRREVLPKTDIDLMLAGHTHAMQVTLFGRSLSEFLYPEWKGLYTEGTQVLYVNIGIGYVGMPFRFGAWPEITVLTLKNNVQ